MNRIDRLTAILIQLQSAKIVKASDIADRFDISLRTVYRDIRALEEAGVPIGAEAGKGYFITDGYFLPPVMFTEEEAGAILLGAKLIEQMSDESINENFTSAMYKIKSVLRTSGKETLENLEAQIAVQKDNRNAERPNYLTSLQKAITTKKAIEIIYFSNYNENTTERIVEPIGLYYYSNAWHLIAFCRMRKDYRDFRIDRIKKLKITDENIKAGERKSLAEYIKSFSDIKGDVKIINLKFRRATAKYIQELRYYYGFVEETQERSFIKMKFMTGNLEYFARWIIMFGKEVEIESPEELQTKVKKLVAELNRHYK